MVKVSNKRKWLASLGIVFLVVSLGTHISGGTWHCYEVGCWGGENCLSDFSPEEFYPCMFRCYEGINKTYMFCEIPGK